VQGVVKGHSHVRKFIEKILARQPPAFAAPSPNSNSNAKGAKNSSQKMPVSPGPLPKIVPEEVSPKLKKKESRRNEASFESQIALLYDGMQTSANDNEDDTLQMVDEILSNWPYEKDVLHHLHNIIDKIGQTMGARVERIVGRLIEIIPWDRMQTIRELVQRESALLFASSTFDLARKESMDAEKSVNLQKLRESLRKVEEAEVRASMHLADEELRKRCEVRQNVRRETLFYLSNELPAFVRALAAFKREETLLLQFVETVILPPESKQTDDSKTEKKQQPLERCYVVCSGSLSLPRKVLFKLIESKGGRYCTEVNEKTTHVVVPDPGKEKEKTPFFLF
jgi:hypothetical protein